MSAQVEVAVAEGQDRDRPVEDAVAAGDEGAFGELVEPLRREPRVHCYRMLSSYDDAEDMVQETFLRAWHRRETYEGRSILRAWLYEIAANACLDLIDRNKRRARPYRVPPLVGVEHPTAAETKNLAGRFRAQVLDVLRIDNGRIIGITSFEPRYFAAFDLPLILP
ncbi:sigma-70 family RNA polymerase sigma factor [Streptosporangium canum]|uniref:sigma-70 family RNA polymerase sigma factor n=1 Tax=Streptosporangium canum TaxID=324952 RepID=UPI0033A724A5